MLVWSVICVSLKQPVAAGMTGRELGCISIEILNCRHTNPKERCGWHSIVFPPIVHIFFLREGENGQIVCIFYILACHILSKQDDLWNFLLDGICKDNASLKIIFVQVKRTRGLYSSVKLMQLQLALKVNHCGGVLFSKNTRLLWFLMCDLNLCNDFLMHHSLLSLGIGECNKIFNYFRW